MAEFTEVMRQAKRMHDMYNRGGYSCADCPLDCSDGRCMLDFDDKFKPEEVERYIMDWAAEHPELVYPSWDEAWKKLFPESLEVPCPKRLFGEDYYPIFVCAEHDCAYCKAMPMHPDVAKKLGIKPITQGEAGRK